ncbi:MAG: ice-binding family protein [bacterium]|nr:ice-binding family protein [bacterium]
MKVFKIGSVLTLLAIFALIGLTGAHVAQAAGPSAINLGSAGNFVILSKTGISTTGSTLITGDIGVSPIAASAITGFSLTLTAQSPYATTPKVVGKVFASDYANPTPSTLSTAISDMQTTYTDGAGRTNPTATELGAGNLGGLTIAPGLYKWGTGVTIPTDVTLSGSSNDVWIFQIAQTLNVSSGAEIVLSGGAKASNIFWVVAGQTTIGTTADFNGTILGQTAIVLNTGASLNGRALAQTAVTLDSNEVTRPSGSSSVSTPAAPAATTPSSSSGSSSSNSTSNNSTSNNNTTTNNTTTNTPTPSTPSVNQPSVSAAATAAGCFGGNKYSIATGEMCLNVADTGCTAGNVFSTQTGARCTLYVGSASVHGQDIHQVMGNLTVGSRGNSVSILQNFLISLNKGVSARALASAGATGYFGGMTKAALAEFQAQAGITPAIGYFGPITRSLISGNY